jgi:outer membrane protein
MSGIDNQEEANFGRQDVDRALISANRRPGFRDETMTRSRFLFVWRFRRQLVTGLALACACPTLRAQEPPQILKVVPLGARTLTLDEARNLAVASNKSIALAQLNVIEKQHVANAARKDYLPKALGSVTYFHFNQDLGSVVTVDRGKLGILAPGVSTFSAAVLNQDSALSTVMLAQPITKLIAVNAAVQIARADQAVAQAKLDKGIRDLISGVSQAYYGLLGAQRIQAALDLQVNMLQQILAAKPSPELKIGLLEAQQGLLQVRGQVQELTDQLNTLIGSPPDTRLELVDPVPADLPVHSPEEAAQLALTGNLEVREAEQSIAQAEAALRVANMAYIPDVNVVGGYANQTAANYIQPNIGYVGVTANYTFWDWGKRKDLKRQRETDIALARQNVLVTMEKVQSEARKAYGTFDQARSALKLAGEIVEARQEAEKAATGVAAFQAKGDTAKAQLEAMKAEITYRVAYADLAGIINRN